MSDTSRPPIQRVHYFSGEALLTDDFICEQRYNMDMLSLLNSTLHTWGIASGLVVSRQQNSQSNQVTITAGMAIDSLGNQIVLATQQVIELQGVADEETVYLTIRYNEVYADYSDESGVPGYKRIVQQPILEYLPTLQQPGITILLAVVSFSAEGHINTLAFQSGKFERRYVGSRVGMVSLVTEGSEKLPIQSVQLQALRDINGFTDYLDVRASRSQFDGVLTTRDSLGIGIDQPQADLELVRIVSAGDGTFTTKGTTITLKPGVYPPLQPGDVIIPDAMDGAALPSPSQLVIVGNNGSNQSGEQIYKLKQGFKDDVLLKLKYSYIRKTLARFSAGMAAKDPPLEVFRIDNDGTVALGMPAAAQSGSAGPAALRITSGRRVSIAFDTDTDPQQALEVNGTVKALSFEGNGSKLENLPILSYWTKQNPTAPQSPIYYNQGNVGVLMTNPPASLSVGTGAGIVGAGQISANAQSPTTQLDGTDTLFTSQVGVGDTIVVGYLMQQWRQIKVIASQTQLEVDGQFASILQQAKYSHAPSDSKNLPAGAQLFYDNATAATAAAAKDSASDVTPGKGTISSNGTIIKGGNGADFSQLQVGDWLVIDAVPPDTSADNQSSWLVKAVLNDTTLTLVEQENAKGEPIPIPANLSAYMVLPALIGLFQSTVTLKSGDPLPVPAMLVFNNGPGGNPANTVAINMGLDEVVSGYALEVNGDVNFNGGSSNVDTLTVRDWATIGLQSTSGNVLTVGPQALPQLLTVTQSNVVIGQSSGTNLLEVGGTLAANAMNVAGVAVNTNGSVAWFGNRMVIPINATNPVCKGAASTDGFIVVSFGPQQTNSNAPDFFGMLSCTLNSGGTYQASASFEYHQDENGAFQNPVFGNLNIPVRNQESWTLALDIRWSYNCELFIEAFWVPLGPDSPAMTITEGSG